MFRFRCVVDKFHDIGDIAMKYFAKYINRMGTDTFIPF